jgi:hypothetical protein
MLDWFTPAQWGTLFGLLTMGAVVISGFAALREVIIERRVLRDEDSLDR